MSVFVSQSDIKWVCMCVSVCMYEQEAMYLSLDCVRVMPQSFQVSQSNGHVLNFH